MEKEKKKLIGFAAMTPEVRKALSKRGGLALHASGKGHYPFRDNPQLASDAGKKGGAASGPTKARPQKKKGTS